MMKQPNGGGSELFFKAVQSTSELQICFLTDWNYYEGDQSSYCTKQHNCYEVAEELLFLYLEPDPQAIKFYEKNDIAIQLENTD